MLIEREREKKRKRKRERERLKQNFDKKILVYLTLNIVFHNQK